MSEELLRLFVAQIDRLQKLNDEMGEKKRLLKIIDMQELTIRNYAEAARARNAPPRTGATHT